MQPTQSGGDVDWLAAKNGEYYGLPVESFVFYLGNSNGISVLLIEFSAPMSEVQERLSSVDYSLIHIESGSYQAELITDAEADRAMLMCDIST